MHEYAEGLESYHYHTCLILPEKDVLDVDIIGTGRIARFRRWWNDLFLLSYNCDRSRGFYASSTSLRMERFRQFRRYKHRIHPMSKFRNFWECLILHVFIINKVLFRFTSTFLYDKLPISLFYFGALLELIIIVDLYVNMKTGFINIKTRRIVLDTNSSLENFFAKKLFLYVASAIPLHWFMFLRYGGDITCGLCKTNRFTCALKIISIFSLIRVIETSSYWCRRRYQKMKYCFFRFIRICTIALVTMIQLYDLSEVVCLLVFLENGHVVKNSILGLKAGLKFSLDVDNSIPNFTYMGLDLARMMQSLLHFSFTFTVEVYYLDRMTAFTGYLITYIFYGWSLLECYGLVNAVMYSKDQNMKIKKKALNFLESNQLSNSLSTKVQEYFKYKATALRITERRNGLYMMLPEMLKNEIKLHCYLNIIMRIPVFTQWPVPVLEQLVVMLKRKVYLANDIVSLAMAQGDGLMIVHDGVLAVYSKFHKELGHLIDGDFFGAISLVTDKEVFMSYVIAVTNSTVLVLNKVDFRNYMKDHPQLFYGFTMDMKARNKLMFTHYDKDDGKSTSSLKQSDQGTRQSSDVTRH